MASIVIKDLSSSTELDREAMTAIVGGARVGGRYPVSGSTLLRTNRIFSYPGNIARTIPEKKNKQGG